MDDSALMKASLLIYIPADRRFALAHGLSLPDRASGTALFADISGFTPLTESLVLEYGPQRGAEEITRHLNLVFDSLIAELDRYGGSVITFAGDAMTCWFDGDTGLSAAAAALGMQRCMQNFSSILLPSGKIVSLAMKVAVSTGVVQRFMVGDPQIQIIDVIAGNILDELADGEHVASKGDILLGPSTVASLGDQVSISDWRTNHENGLLYGKLDHLNVHIAPKPFPPIDPESFSLQELRSWLLPPVYDCLCSGLTEFLAELRPAVALFLRFTGMDYEKDEAAEGKLDTFVRHVENILARYEGSLFQLILGDKGSYLYAVFGAPIAHEDDTNRAASAALELQSLTKTLDFISSIQIGINQGRMRAGGYGGTTRRTYGVVGDEVNLAARLMQAAAPGLTLVSFTACQSCTEQFEWEQLPEIRVKGKAQPVKVFSLKGVKKHNPYQPKRMGSAIPMIGREHESQQIHDRLMQAIHGRGQIVGITGDVGIGKSRLVLEAIRMAKELNVTCYQGDCQSYGTNMTYLVWQSIWSGLFFLDTDLPVEVQLQVLDTTLMKVNPSLASRLPLLGPIFNLPIPDNDLTRSLDAKLRKASLEALLIDCLRAYAQQGPLFLVLEDCHWLDDLSHDLLEALGRAITNLPVFILLAYRPLASEHRPELRVARLPYFTEIQLVDFTPLEAEQMVSLKLAQVYGCRVEAVPFLMKRIIEQAEGNPFYIEELLNYLKDRGIDPTDSQALEGIDLPTSLYSLILSRIDQLAEKQKITLKVASIIGRLFKAAWLWGYYPEIGDPKQVKADLDALSRLDLTPLDPSEQEVTYLFKHIITQQVTYESLLYATRTSLHDKLAGFIENVFSASINQYIDLLAYHYSHTENQPKKCEYLVKAGEAAQASYANATAIDYYQRVLPLLAPPQHVQVSIKLGQVLELIGQWKQAGEFYQRALEQALLMSDQPTQAKCQTCMAELMRKQGHYPESASWLDQAQALYEQLDDPEGTGQVLHFAGTLAAQQGDYPKARSLYEKSLEIRQNLGDRGHTASLLSNLGIVARFQGDYALARSFHERALAIRRELGDRWAIGVSLNNLGNVAVDQGNFNEARLLHEEGLAIRREVGDRWAIANALNNLGNLARAQGEYDEAVTLYNESLAINQELGDRWAIAYLLEDIGCLAALQGQARRAVCLVSSASVLRQAIGAPLSPAEAKKIEGFLEPARQGMTEAEQADATKKGREFSEEQAIVYAREGINHDH
jgi:adenylate cyclase